MNNFVDKKYYKELGKGIFFEPRRHKPTVRNEKEFPILSDFPKLSDNEKAEANYNGRLLSWEITKKHTEHLQENAQMIVDFLNQEWQLTGDIKIIGNSIAHSNFRLWTKHWRLTFDLKKGKIEKEFFLNSVKEVVGVIDSTSS